MKKKRGAPKKADAIAKREVYQLRLSEAEKLTFARAAEIDGKTMADWMRDRLRAVSRRELEDHGESVPFLANSVSKKS